MKRKTVALYDPYLDIMGGGERHILSILKVLQEQGFDVTIYWDTDLSANIKKTLQIDFKEPLQFKPNIFKSASESVFSKLNILKEFDLFIYVTDGSYFFSSAKRTFIFCMVPQKSLYNMSAINKLKTMNFTFIANSFYTSNLLQKWGVDAKVLYPYIPLEFIDNYSAKKEKIILSVGRFFKQLHSKRQDVAISWFNSFQNQDKKYENYKLILAGSLREEDKGYYNELQQMAKGNPTIEFRPNISFTDLLKLYKEAEVYWHLAGIDVDVKKNPENVEHLGIAPLEAMASGCVVFAYNAGGLKELIRDGKNGFLFSSKDQLFSKMGYALYDDINKQIVCEEAKKFVENTFSYNIFSKRVVELMI